MKFIQNTTLQASRSKAGNLEVEPNEIIALGLTEAQKANTMGNRTKMFKQALEGLTDNGMVIKQAADTSIDELPGHKLAADVITSMENQPVLDQFSPILDVDPGELAIDKGGALINGHTANADKVEDEVKAETRDFFPKALYNLTKIDHMTFLTQTRVVKFAVDRASAKVADALAQAILVGGLKNEDGSDFTAVKPILGDSLATEKTVANAPLQIGAAIAADVADLNAANPVVFIASDVYKSLWANALDNVAMLQILGKDSPFKIIATPILNGKAAFMVVDPSAYTLGFQSKGIESLSDFAITKNSEYLESRVYAAGTLNRANAATVELLGAAPATA